MEMNYDTFNKTPPVPSVTVEMLSYVRNLLLNRIFIGSYGERRYVDHVKEYRDVVKISPAETELLADLDIIKQKLQGNYGLKWLGITGPHTLDYNPGYNLWVQLTNQPFGSFWFQIKQIKLINEEIILRLNCIREVRKLDFEGALFDNVPRSENEGNDKDQTEYSFDFDPEQLIAASQVKIRQLFLSFTWTNFAKASKVALILAIMTVLAIIEIIKYLLHYSLNMVRELTHLIEVLTPIFMLIIDCLTKTVGGLLILIASIIRGYQVQKQLELERNQIPRKDLPKLMPAHSTGHGKW